MPFMQVSISIVVLVSIPIIEDNSNPPFRIKLFLYLEILLILLLIFMFAPSKDTKKSAQTSGYIDGSYSSPLTLGENELEMQVTVKNGKPQSAALKHLDKTVKTMYPLVESSLKEINKQLPKVKNIDDIEFDDQSQYTSTILKQAIKNALKKAQE